MGVETAHYGMLFLIWRDVSCWTQTFFKVGLVTGGEQQCPLVPFLLWAPKRKITGHILLPTGRFLLDTNVFQGLFGDRGQTAIFPCPLVVMDVETDITRHFLRHALNKDCVVIQDEHQRPRVP